MLKYNFLACFDPLTDEKVVRSYSLQKKKKLKLKIRKNKTFSLHFFWNGDIILYYNYGLSVTFWDILERHCNLFPRLGTKNISMTPNIHTLNNG